MKRKPLVILFAVFFLSLFFVGTNRSALACGGFFCQNSPVDQNAERIIFTQNKDGTISAYIQIEYTGFAPDFSWILPMPSAISAEDVEVPEDSMAAFDELEAATAPVYIPPPFPESCMSDDGLMFAAVPEAEDSAEEGGVEIFASGEVGPYGFDVVGSDDPDAMIFWLRDNEYRVTEEMEPLINIYVQEKFVFLAMRLLPESEGSDVEPVKVTYKSDRPMIPLRLTAVAANPDMRVLTWFYADRQAVPENFAHLDIPDEEIVFFQFGGNNYRSLLGQYADDFGGQGFITEYAAPSRELGVIHPLLQDLANQYPYLTRLSTVISPEEMTVDPIFNYDPQRKDVSNVHDLSNLSGVWDCDTGEESNTISLPIFSSNDEPGDAGSGISAVGVTELGVGLLVGCLVGLLVVAGGTIIFLLGRRKRS